MVCLSLLRIINSYISSRLDQTHEKPSVLFHLIITVCVYSFLFICLHEDPRVATTIDSATLKALSIDANTYEYRANRFNNYISTERFRSGPGELGRGVETGISDAEMKRVNDEDGYNSYACKLTALDRSLGHRPAKE